MRPKQNNMVPFDFKPSNLKLTNKYYAQYESISKILDETPRILNRIQKDLKQALAAANHGRGRRFLYTSDTLLRIILCKKIEGMSFRQIIIRIDDSHYLRRFVRLYDGPMMDYTTLNKLENALSSGTWKALNWELAKAAVREESIDGKELRLDTTAVETNIHYPTDSSLLWDTYRVFGRLLELAREIDPEAVGSNRLHLKRVKKIQTKIARQAGKKGVDRAVLEKLYRRLIQHVEGICTWSAVVAGNLQRGIDRQHYEWMDSCVAEYLVDEIPRNQELATQVIHQARRRILEDEKVPNDEKLFSIFEEHTELLIRGKAGKNVEFGHMILIGQTKQKFITTYDVFEKKPVEHTLLNPVLKEHKRLFGDFPECLTTDKGFYESMPAIEKLQKKVKMVSIAKKGRRTPEETEREMDPLFRHAQCFRAGVEGTISFLKRVFRLFRIVRKGWEHFAAEVGATVFAHNLLILART